LEFRPLQTDYLDLSISEAKGGMAVLENVIDFIFIADILINFRTAYQTSEGVLVTGNWEVAKVCHHIYFS